MNKQFTVYHRDRTPVPRCPPQDRPPVPPSPPRDRPTVSRSPPRDRSRTALPVPGPNPGAALPAPGPAPGASQPALGPPRVPCARLGTCPRFLVPAPEPNPAGTALPAPAPPPVPLCTPRFWTPVPRYPPRQRTRRTCPHWHGTPVARSAPRERPRYLAARPGTGRWYRAARLGTVIDYLAKMMQVRTN